MFNKQLQEQIDDLEYTVRLISQSFESKIAKLERLIVESGLVAEYEQKDPIHTVYNLNGNFYTLKEND
jgi:hypothetical protein